MYTYLIERPGEYTKEQLRNYKSLDAYNYYVSGWVQTVYYHDLPTNCVLKANVKASQRLNEKPHQAWVAMVKKSSQIITGHCSCMAGNSESCSHVTAILYKVEACSCLELTKQTSTSLPCRWNQTFSRNVNPLPASEIEFFKPKHGKQKRKTSSSHDTTPPVTLSKLNKQDVYTKLFKYAPDAVLSTVVRGFTTPKQRQKEVEPNLPSALTDLFEPQYSSFPENVLSQLVSHTFNRLKITQEEADFLEASTTKQS